MFQPQPCTCLELQPRETLASLLRPKPRTHHPSIKTW